MLYQNSLNYGSFFFIGIGGVSMSALAKLLLGLGKSVAGYDATESEYVSDLRALGVKVVSDKSLFDAKGYEAAVYTDAIRDDDELVLRARKAGCRLIKRGALLADVCSAFSTVIAVSGCHGKTTCTSMLAHIFDCAKKNFACHIGGKDLKFSNYRFSGFDYFITEACEYKKNFLLLNPTVSIVLNSDADHMECYSSENELKECYKEFLNKGSKRVVLYGDLTADGAITFGFDDRADYYARRITGTGKYSFDLYGHGAKIGRVNLNVYGKHNVLNALAATAAAEAVGIESSEILRGLEDFSGVERRFEVLGEFNGATCVADYAHHPNEIKAAVRTAKAVTDGKLFVVFQPHTYSRTKKLFSGFVRATCQLNNLLIYKTFAAREYFDDAGSALTLSKSIKKSRYADGVQDIYYFLNSVKRGDTVLFLGAGDIYDIAKAIIKANGG